MKKIEKLFLAAAGLGFFLFLANRTSSTPTIQTTQPKAMMMTYSGFNKDNMNMLKQYGIDTIFRIGGAGYWNRIEPNQGQFDFSTITNSLQLAKDANLQAIPTMDFFQNVPQWFIDTYPDSIMKYGNNTNSIWLSNAWLIHSYNNNTTDYKILENTIIQFLNELKKWDNVVGIELPWRIISTNYDYINYTTGDISNNPSIVPLSGFDKYYRDAWTDPNPMLNYVQDYNNASTSIKTYWQNWIEDINGEAIKILLDIIANNFPDKYVIIDKFWWNEGLVPTIGGKNKYQFDRFFSHMKSYSTTDNYKKLKNIIFDNDAFFDPNLVTRSLYSKNTITNSGFLYMGEDKNSNGTVMQNSYNNIVAVQPNVFTFIPYPGGKGEQIQTTLAQQIIAYMNTI